MNNQLFHVQYRGMNIKYADEDAVIKSTLLSTVDKNNELKKRSLFRQVLHRIAICNNQDNTKNSNQASYKVSKGAVVLTRSGQSGVSQPSVLVRNPSEKLIDFAQMNDRNRPQENILAREKEMEFNHKYYYEDIHRLEDLLGLELSHWLEK